MSSLVLANARLPDGRIADITVVNGRVSHIGSSDAGIERIDCGQCLAVPAACDMHVHMRDGVQAAKEDWASGTMSAVAGGVSTVVDQPNSIPPNETKTDFLNRTKLAKEKSYVNFGINGSVTEKADYKGLIEAGALAFGEMFAGASSYGSALSSKTMDRALFVLSKFNALVTVHAEEVLTSEVNTLKEHCLSRPVFGESAVIKLVNSVSHGARLHYCHISSAESFDLIEGTFEATPHHLFLNIESAKNEDDARFKMNPPLRSKKEQTKLFSEFEKIPVIASDHAPHTYAEKSVEFSKAPSGIPGVETMMPLLMNAVFEKKLSLESVLAKTVANPCSILNIEAPQISVSGRADIALYPREPTKIKAEELHGKADWTPYEGMNGVFPLLTLVNGTVVYDRGEFFRGDAVMFKNNLSANMRGL